MRILILGAGQVGSTLAASLVAEGTDIVVVDTDEARLTSLSERYDIGTVLGHAAHPDILRRAGGAEADLVIAVTALDEINMVACEVCHRLFSGEHPQKRIARIRAAAYLAHPELFCPEFIPIDVLISPESEVTAHIQRLIAHPGALQVIEFGAGRLELVGMRAQLDGPLVGKELRTLREHLPAIDLRIAAIYRRLQAVEPTGDTVIEPDDDIFFLAASEHIPEVMNEFHRSEGEVRRLVIAGGGHIGARLAETLETAYDIKLIEHNEARSRQLSAQLRHCLVLRGSATDQELLEEIGVDQADVFCALTNDDEANIMASLLAKRMGARKVMTLMTNPAYVDLVQGASIDIAISPQLITIGSILKHLRQGDLVSVHSLRRGAAEALEVIARGEAGRSRLVGHTIATLELPPGTRIGALIRGETVLMAHHDTVIEDGDRVVFFVTDKRSIPDVEKLLQPVFRLF